MKHATAAVSERLIHVGRFGDFFVPRRYDISVGSARGAGSNATGTVCTVKPQSRCAVHDLSFCRRSWGCIADQRQGALEAQILPCPVRWRASLSAKRGDLRELFYIYSLVVLVVVVAAGRRAAGPAEPSKLQLYRPMAGVDESQLLRRWVAHARSGNAHSPWHPELDRRALKELRRRRTGAIYVRHHSRSATARLSSHGVSPL